MEKAGIVDFDYFYFYYFYLLGFPNGWALLTAVNKMNVTYYQKYVVYKKIMGYCKLCNWARYTVFILYTE